MRLNKISTCIALSLSVSSVNALAEEPVKNEDIESIVITGTSKGRLVSSTPQSVTVMGEFEVAKLASGSQADILRSIPGIKVEGGGGEVATNLQVRGLPSTGQFQFTPLLVDGSPVFSTFGLNSSAFDVYTRSDLGYEKIEFVRGGVSNLFGPGSVAGIINYQSKVGQEESESTIQLEVAEEGRMRADFATSGALSTKEDLYYALSGFYRYDEGPIDTGLPTEGYQLRGNIHKEFDDGSFTLFAQAIDDSVQFFLPFPLDAETQERTPGNDGNDVNSAQTVHASGLSYQSADGRFESPIQNGVSTKGGSIAFSLDKDLTDDLSLNAKARYANYKHQFNLFLDGDGLVNVPETQEEYLANRELGDLADAQFTYADSGQALAADDLLFANRLLDRDRPATDFTAEFNLTKVIDTDNFSHSVTVGTFFSRAEAGDYNIISRYLGEFNNQPRLVNLTVNDLTYSDNGVVGPGVGYNNKTLSATRKALYIADQFDNEEWVFDIGFRVERLEGTIQQEGNESVTISDDPTLAPNLQVSTTGNGKITHGSVAATDSAFSFAALYRLNDNMNVYGNVSKGFFFPEVRSVKFDALGNEGSYEAETIEQGELGIKFFGDDYSGSVALFFANLNDRNSVSFENDANGGIIERSSLQSTEATGIEAAMQYDITDSFKIDGNFTYQDHEFTENDSDDSIIGKELLRKPNVLANIGLKYNDGVYDASLYYNYHGDNFANNSNTVELDAFSLVNLDAGYTLSFGDDETLRFSVSVFNLTDSDGVTEGSPRQGNSQSADGAFFVGRPILPRRVTARIRYDF